MNRAIRRQLPRYQLWTTIHRTRLLNGGVASYCQTLCRVLRRRQPPDYTPWSRSAWRADIIESSSARFSVTGGCVSINNHRFSVIIGPS